MHFGLLGRENTVARLASALPARLLSVLALPFGFFVGAYTGVLIGATSVPMWARNVVLMGPTFLTSALSTGLSGISFILHLGDWGEKRTLEALRRAERVILIVEGGLLAASLVRMGQWGKPLRSKKLAPLFFGGTILGGLLAPLGLLCSRESRSRELLASALGLLGGLALRWAMIEGGKLSARDPQATFTFAKKENPSGHRLRG
jgi:formate-dependent nitrite reductase membrane component NrfD